MRQLAAAQAGLVSAEQAGLLGLGNQAARRLVAQGHWSVACHGVYDTRPGVESPEKQAWLAVLRGGEPCALGGDAALRVLGLERPAGIPLVWVPADRRPRSSADALMRRDTIGRLSRRRGLLPRISAEDAVIDVAEHLHPEAAVALFSDAVRRRIVSLVSLRATVGARARVRERRMLLALLGDLSGIESTLEYAYRRDVERAHGLPRARRQVQVSRGSRSDALYEEYGLLVELDGRAGHVDAESAFRDLSRDNRHAELSLVTLRYGSRDVRGRPCEVARQVAGVLRIHGWPGDITPCPRCAHGLQ